MKQFLIGVALVAAAALPAAAQQRTVQLNFNLSPAGQAIAKRYLGAPDPRMKDIATRAGALSQRQRALVAAPKLDMAQFTAILRQQEQLQAQAARIGNDRMIKMLGEMSEADRVAFLRGLANPTAAPAPPRK